MTIAADRTIHELAQVSDEAAACFFVHAAFVQAHTMLKLIWALGHTQTRTHIHTDSFTNTYITVSSMIN